MISKKIAIGIIAAIVLCGCGSSQSEGASSSGSSRSGNKSNYEEIALNETVSTDYAEVTLENSTITSAAAWERDDGTSASLEEQKDQLYFVFLGKVKNLSTDSIDFYNNFKAELILDDKYEYPVTTDPSDLESIVPLKTSSFTLYAAAPKEVLDSCESYKLNMGYMDGFQSVAGVEYCDHQYTYSGSVNEYGSGENIQNYQTFKEYATSAFSGTDSMGHGFKIEDSSADNVVNITGEHASGTMDQGANDYLFITPIFRVDYFIYKLGNNYGSLEIECHESGTGVRHKIADGMTIKSDAGSMSTGELDVTLENNGYSYNFFNSTDHSFSELENIINGSNLQFVFNIVDYANNSSVTKETYTVSDDMKAALQYYMQVYKGMPNVNLD